MHLESIYERAASGESISVSGVIEAIGGYIPSRRVTQVENTRGSIKGSERISVSRICWCYIPSRPQLLDLGARARTRAVRAAAPLGWIGSD